MCLRFKKGINKLLGTAVSQTQFLVLPFFRNLMKSALLLLTIDYKCSKFKMQSFSNNYWLSGPGFAKKLVQIETGKTLIRLLLQKQSGVGILCLSRPFWQATIEILEHLPYVLS